MLQLRAIGIALLTGGALLLGCASEDDESTGADTSGHPPAAMVGSWIFQSATVNGSPVALDSVMEWQPQTVQAKLHVQTNSAYVFEEVNIGGGQLWFESGFVFIDGAEIDVNAQLDSDGPASETTRWSFTLNDTVFTLSRVDSGQTVFYTLVM